jgi:hypothetical protein
LGAAKRNSSRLTLQIQAHVQSILEHSRKVRRDAERMEARLYAEGSAAVRITPAKA